jgi:hypothetical protein
MLFVAITNRHDPMCGERFLDGKIIDDWGIQVAYSPADGPWSRSLRILEISSG